MACLGNESEGAGQLRSPSGRRSKDEPCDDDQVFNILEFRRNRCERIDDRLRQATRLRQMLTWHFRPRMLSVADAVARPVDAAALEPDADVGEDAERKQAEQDVDAEVGDPAAGPEDLAKVLAWRRRPAVRGRA